MLNVHVGLNVTNLEKSIEFYTKVFGLDLELSQYLGHKKVKFYARPLSAALECLSLAMSSQAQTA